MLAIEVLRSRDAVRRLWNEWDALCDASMSASPFQRPGWSIPWMARMGVASPRVVAMRSGRELVGLLPAFAWDARPGRMLSLLGAGVSDHLDAIAAAGFEQAIADAASAWINETRTEWDGCAFDEIGPDAVLRGLRPPAGTKAAAVAQSVCPVLTFADGGTDLEQVIPIAQAARLRKARRRCERLGSVDFERADRGAFAQAVGELFALHARRWALRGTDGAFGDRRMIGLLEEVAVDFAKRRSLRLYVLRVSARPAGVVYGFRERSRLYLYVQGIEPEFERASPGLVAVGLVIADSLAEGVREIDFLRGDEEYKYRWGAVDQENVRVTVERR
jgi:CelD/BcsL family acetyltransferase involved in cellulose biosynthesis